MNLCKICRHPQRDAIDNAVIRLIPTRTIRDQFGITLSSLNRHVNHLSDLFASAKKSDALRRRKSLLVGIGRVHATSLEIVRVSMANHDHEMALKAIARLEKQIELHAKIGGDMNGEADLDADAEQAMTKEQWAALHTLIGKKLA